MVKQLLELIGGIPVDRKSACGVVGQVVSQFSAKEKMILAVAPEGTRSPKLPWKTGFLAIAHQAKAHVVLIGFDYARKRIVFGSVFLSQGNFDDDMQKVYGFFSTITAKYPKNVIFPKDM